MRNRLTMLSSTVQVSLADLLQFNPSANVNGPVAPGTSLTRPCYPANQAPTYRGMQQSLFISGLENRLFLRISPAYHVACEYAQLFDHLTCSGGNIAYAKVASQSTTVGTGTAGLAVAFPAASTQKTCTLTRDGTKAAPAWWVYDCKQVVCHIFCSCRLGAWSCGQLLTTGAIVSTMWLHVCRWSLDLGVSTDIVGVVIAAQTAVGDLKIAIGDNESPLSNAECSVGVQIEANATSAQVCR
jgi:hypothetical protein